MIRRNVLEKINNFRDMYIKVCACGTAQHTSLKSGVETMDPIYYSYIFLFISNLVYFSLKTQTLCETLDITAYIGIDVKKSLWHISIWRSKLGFGKKIFLCFPTFTISDNDVKQTTYATISKERRFFPIFSSTFNK